MGHNVSEQITVRFFRVKMLSACIFGVQVVVDGSFATSVPIYQVALSHIPEYRNFSYLRVYANNLIWRFSSLTMLAIILQGDMVTRWKHSVNTVFDFGFSRRWTWRLLCSGTWCHGFLIDRNQRFREKTATLSLSETRVSFQETTLHHLPKKTNLQSQFICDHSQCFHIVRQCQYW
jgi:hypothetical protein